MNIEVALAALSILVSIVIAGAQGTWRWRRDRLPGDSSPLSFGDIDERRSFSVQDAVKILDLRGSPARGPDGHGSARLSDTYLVRRENDAGNGLVSFYSTSGSLRVQSVSHQLQYNSAEAVESHHMRHNNVVTVPLDSLASGATTRVINQADFQGAYDGVVKENFETHIERPTRSLVIMLLFADDYRCSEIRGFVRPTERAARKEAPSDMRPVVLDDGRSAYWHITPSKGKWLPMHSSLRLEWQWREVREAEPARGARLPDGRTPPA